jgi:hypothetical protein
LEAQRHAPVPYRISPLVARLFFRGIYFPHKGAWGWIRLLAANSRAIFGLIRDAFRNWPGGRGGAGAIEFDAPRRAEVETATP